MVASFDAIELARLKCHHLFQCLHEYERRYKSLAGFSHKFGVPFKRVKLSSSALRELGFWIDLSLAECYVSCIRPTKVCVLFTDASTRAWGAVGHF